MRIALLIPGTCETFYCENCLRDFELTKAVCHLGHEIEVVPLYLPLTASDASETDETPIFFGGINTYLQQKSGLFRRLPRFVGRVLDSRRLLRWAAGKAEMTSPRDLGETTVSMLRGEQGCQARELDRMVTWLDEAGRPDVVCLSSALLVGMAREVRRRLKTPIICMLQDEDGFLDGLPPPHNEHAWEAMIERAAEVDAFISASHWYATTMRARLGLDEEKVHVVHHGLDLEGYEPADSPPEVPTIGFLSPSIPDKGLDLLVEALHLVRQRPGLDQARLTAVGGTTAGSRPYLEKIRADLDAWDLADAVDIGPNLRRAERQDWLRSLSVLSVPTRRPEASATFVLEANACGVPAVEPAHGAVEEIVESTGGGVLVPPGDVRALADALADLLSNPDRARTIGRRGHDAVHERFDVWRSARAVLDIIEKEAGADDASELATEAEPREPSKGQS